MKYADIHWQTDQQGNLMPISTQFDDVYFSKAGGFAETNYVFLDSNDLPERFARLCEHERFVIAETGFGTGLNFLATCLLWQKTAPPSARLYFVSTEKYPLSPTDLATALSVWQDDDTCCFINELMDKYPLAIAGCHRLHFGNIVLDLWLGDALVSLTKMPSHMIDAWFLDGFAPTKNNALWSDDIFKQIKRLSKPSATLATFSSSGLVRRALQSIGMNVFKIKGFGKKREMIKARFDTTKPCSKPLPTTATVIGAGVSGLFASYALANRGVSVTVIDKLSPLAGASGNPKALFAPKLSLIDGVDEHLPTMSFLYAERIYHSLNQSSNTNIFNQTGVIDFLLPTQKSYDKLKSLIDSYPDELITTFNDDKHSNHDDFNRQLINTIIKKAGLIDPHKLANTILSHPLITFKQFNVKDISTHLEHILLSDGNQQLSSDIAIICAGFESHLLNNALFNPRKIRGQVSWLNIKNRPQTLKSPLTTPIKYDGYCAQFDDLLLMGASFVRNDTDTSVRDDEHGFNLDKFAQSLPSIAQSLNINVSQLCGRASIRAQTPDYHPVIGQIGGRLYAMYGMGSKGFGFAPLCGELLAGLIFDEPLPMPHTMLDKISPTRPRLQTPIDQHR